MPPIRPKLSITLPRNFTFHYTDGQGPKTPEDVVEGELRQPSPPRPYRLRTRRRRGLLFDQANNSTSSSSSSSIPPHDVPIPTIETSKSVVDPEPLSSGSSPEPVEGLLAPMPSRNRFISPPKTPLAQIFTSFDAPGEEDRERTPREDVNPGESISRPTSACSTFSNSSDSSSDSSTSFPSTGGSCTSPESDAPDPFAFSRLPEKGKRKLRSLSSDRPAGQAPRRTRQIKHTNWTPDMDTHLWTTYLLYRDDPTVTPFRTTLGTAPPLGVCCRIARKARKTWRGPLASLKALAGSGTKKEQQKLRDVNDEANAVDSTAISVDLNGSKSGSATPTGPLAEKPYPKWPTSEAATRRRLRYLCKRKPAPSNHRNRLLQSRSPTPLQSTRRRRLASPMGDFRPVPSFSTYDMTYSLTASTAASMRPDGALAQLTRPQPEMQHDNEQWFGQSAQGEASGSYSQSSLPSRVGLGIGGIDGANTFPRLGSPFAGRTRPSVLDPTYLRPPSPCRTQSDTAAVMGPTLRSPLDLNTPIPFPPALKRRAQHTLEDELSPGGSEMHRNMFKELFGAPVDNRHRRVRSRGFSLGDVSDATRLASITTPPAMYDQMDGSEAASSAGPGLTSGASQGPSSASLATPDRSQRLGSPFGGPEPHSDIHLQRRSFDDANQAHERFPEVRQMPPLSHVHGFHHVGPSIDERLGALREDDSGRSKRMRG